MAEVLEDRTLDYKEAEEHRVWLEPSPRWVRAFFNNVPVADSKRVVLLYEALGRVAPSPVVELNRAVAVAMANGPQHALSIVDELVASDRLPGSYLLPSVRGELLVRLGRTAEARAELELAARLSRNVRERSVLLRKAAALT